MSDYFSDDDIMQFNKLGITDRDELRKAEEEIVAARMVEIVESPIGGNYDFNMLRSIHEKLFSDIYHFAGKVRTVRIAKDKSVFCYPEYIEDNQKRIFEELKRENHLINLSQEEFIRKFAALTEELNALHPFREGNGRVIRIFLKQLAEHAGWYIAYEDMDPHQLLDADVKAFNGDLDPLTNLIRDHITEY